MQKVFNLMKSYLFSHLFPLPEETDHLKLLLRLISKNLLPVVSSKNYVALGLTFKSLIHF